MPNGLAIPGGVTFPILAPDGSEAAPSYSFQSAPSSGLFAFSAGRVTIAVAGSTALAFQTAGAAVVRGLAFSPNPINVTEDLYLNRLAAASLGLGGSPSATPVAQTFTIGEASRPGTDTNVGGASGTIRSGLGTGTGTASSLIFQTPTLAASGTGAQTYATRLTVATAGVTVDSSIPLTVQSFAVTSQVGTVAFGGDGNTYFGFNASYFSVSANVAIGFTNTSTSPFAAVDTRLSRLAAASLLLGLAPSATPVAQTFTIGEASRPGTDTNVGGASGTIRSGLGTGTGTASSLLFQTPTLAASGTGTQAYATRLTVATAAITGAVQFSAPNGSAATVGYAFAVGANYGFYTPQGNTVGCAVNGVLAWACTSALFQLAQASVLGWSSDPGNVASDLGITRLAAASLRQGLAPSATPVNQTFTIGEASRPGTDTDVGGASGTIRSGLGTGTGTASSLIFQTPTVAASGTGAQTYTTRMTLGPTYVIMNVPVTGSVFYAGLSSGTEGALLVSNSAGTTGVVLQSADAAVFGGALGGMALGSAQYVSWDSSASGAAGTPDLALARLGAASLRQGKAPSATPVAQTFTIGEFSRVGTDNNVAGSDGTIRSGSGTGNAAGSSLFFDTPTVGASGTVQQSYGHRLTLSALGATFDIPDQGLRINNQVNGAGASAGTLTNAPAAGNPTFWLPINVAGTVRFCPLW